MLRARSAFDGRLRPRLDHSASLRSPKSRSFDRSSEWNRSGSSNRRSANPGAIFSGSASAAGAGWPAGRGRYKWRVAGRAAIGRERDEPIRRGPLHWGGLAMMAAKLTPFSLSALYRVSAFFVCHGGAAAERLRRVFIREYGTMSYAEGALRREQREGKHNRCRQRRRRGRSTLW